MKQKFTFPPFEQPIGFETEKSEKLSESAETAGYVQVCPHCKEEIPLSMVQQGGLHMYCFGVEIDVWFVSLPDAPKCGFYEKDISQIANILLDAEDAYLIERQQMKAGLFYNLPEFEGF